MTKISMRAARVNKGLTIAQSAQQLGLTLNTLWRYENGLTIPDASTIDKMIKLYEIPYSHMSFTSARTD
jgi:transcriptional regulator with XRE-family HTH domain